MHAQSRFLQLIATKLCLLLERKSFPLKLRHNSAVNAVMQAETQRFRTHVLPVVSITGIQLKIGCGVICTFSSKELLCVDDTCNLKVELCLFQTHPTVSTVVSWSTFHWTYSIAKGHTKWDFPQRGLGAFGQIQFNQVTKVWENWPTFASFDLLSILVLTHFMLFPLWFKANWGLAFFLRRGSILQSCNLRISSHKLLRHRGLDTNRRSSGYGFQEAQEQVVWETHLHEACKAMSVNKRKGKGIVTSGTQTQSIK